MQPVEVLWVRARRGSSSVGVEEMVHQIGGVVFETALQIVESPGVVPFDCSGKQREADVDGDQANKEQPGDDPWRHEPLRMRSLSHPHDSRTAIVAAIWTV